MIEVRRYKDSDWSSVWPLLRATFSTGHTYAYPPESSEAEVYRVWIESPSATFVATEPDGRIVGTYFIKPNQPGLASHVSNCGYVVAPDSQGKGIASLMCEHSQERAIEMGFRAMQFNLVVATNERALRLWKRLGFSIIGRVPGGFHHRTLGYVDAFIMFKELLPGT